MYKERKKQQQPHLDDEKVVSITSISNLLITLNIFFFQEMQLTKAFYCLLEKFKKQHKEII